VSGTPALAAVVGVFGLVIGSFLNVVIWRVPRHESIVSPPSHCPGCDAEISPRDNIPVVSWLILRGRCRHCGKPISPRYPAVEALTGLLFAAAALKLGAHAALADYCAFFAVLVALAGIDLDHRLVPRRIVYPAAAVSLVLLAIATVVDGGTRNYVDALIGGAAAFAALFVVHFVSPRGMGFGDVRLAGYIGLNVGWLGLARVAVGLFSGFLFGAVVGVAIMAAGRGGRKTAVPFAPFLAAGAVVAVLFGGPIVRAWLGP